MPGRTEPLPPPDPRAAPRRQVVPERRADPDQLLADARDAMAIELGRLKRKAAVGAGLETEDIKALALLTDAACKLAREERDAAKANDLTGLSVDELLAQSEAAKAKLREP